MQLLSKLCQTNSKYCAMGPLKHFKYKLLEANLYDQVCLIDHNTK